jgi:DNA-binding response OmpR family regulator
MKKKILVVDDEVNFVALLKKRLEANNFNVISAPDGAEGLKKAREEQPNLILLDILMPNKDGFSTVKDLKAEESTRRIPVIVLTAKGDTSSLFKSKELGVDDYIIKPFDAKVLLKYINRYIL